MAKKRITQESIINAFLFSAFENSAGASSLQDISDILQIKKASLYNHFKSKDEMYFATIEYCKVYLSNVNFISDEMREKPRLFEESVQSVFRKVLKRFINIYEEEPCFQIYTFIHTEQFFNLHAMEIRKNEIEKIEEGFLFLLKGFIDAEKLPRLTPTELRSTSSMMAAVVVQQLDLYIIQKKETVRQNPESGVGSLFALPTDDATMNSILKLFETYIKVLVKSKDFKEFSEAVLE